MQNLSTDAEFKSILKNGGLVFSSQIWTVASNLVLNYIVARIYGAHVNGIIGIISTILNFTVVFGLSGLNIAALKIIPEHLSKHSYYSAMRVTKQMFKIVALNTLILCIIVFFGSRIIAETFFNKPQLEIYIKITAIFIVPFTLQTFNESIFKAFRRIKEFAITSIIINTLKVLTLVVLGYYISSQDLPIYIILFSFVLLFIVGTWLIFTRKNKSKGKSIQIESYKSIRLFALPMFLAAASTILISTVDIFILTAFVEEDKIGIYYMANRLANLITFMLLAINSVAAARFSEYYTNSKIEELKKSSKKATLIIFAFSLPVALAFIVFGKPILSLFGSEFEIGATALIYIACGRLINASTGSVGWLLNMTGNQNIYCFVAVGGGVISIILNLLLIPEMGITGAAISNMTSMVFVNVLCLIFVRIKLGFWNTFI